MGRPRQPPIAVFQGALPTVDGVGPKTRRRALFFSFSAPSTYYWSTRYGFVNIRRGIINQMFRLF
jgi:hypothetical protein